MAAVTLYNSPAIEFRTGAYVPLIVIAWTSLFHAVFYRRRVKPWIVDSGTGRGTRYRRIGGDPVHWSLRDCLREYYPGQTNAVTKNLEFLIGLRDRIEHRNMPELDHNVFGELQAALLNFEECLTREFGERYSLNTSLAFSLQFSGLIPEKREQAMRALRRSASDSVSEYVRTFRSELDPGINGEQQFAFRAYMFPKPTTRDSSDAFAVEFVQFDSHDPEAMKSYDQAVVLMRHREVTVRDLGHRPSSVATIVETRIPWKFNTTLHARCWKFFGVRPPTAADDPRLCDEEFCMWDTTFSQHVYTGAWIEKLVQELADPQRFLEIAGTDPILKDD